MGAVFVSLEAEGVADRIVEILEEMRNWTSRSESGTLRDAQFVEIRVDISKVSAEERPTLKGD